MILQRDWLIDVDINRINRWEIFIIIIVQWRIVSQIKVLFYDILFIIYCKKDLYFYDNYRYLLYF